MWKWIFLTAVLVSCATVELAKVSELNREEVKKVFVSHQNEIEGCHNQVPQKEKALGKMVFEFEVNDAGKVIHSAWVDDKSSLKNEPLGACIAEKIKTWDFPKAASTETAFVYYPVLFK